MNNHLPLQKLVLETFRDQFGGGPDFIARAPGRVNLIGEHTDYNDGFVLPMAIDRAIYLGLRPRPDRQVVVYSLGFEQRASFHLDDLHHKEMSWIEYIKGIAWSLQDAGYPTQGWEGVLAGDVPIGAGLSSSAALEIATLKAFEAVVNFTWDSATMARIAQRADNSWVGIQSGIMDQLVSAAGRAGQALLIDCRSLEIQYVPLPVETAVVILDTTTRRGLVDSAYNERRAQCEAAARFFNVDALRDVPLEDFQAREAALDPIRRQRARHVITENARTLAAAQAMEQSDAIQLGTLMNASHTSLRDDYEVSSKALNAMVACARNHTGCFGARLTGAGFGGCAVALVNRMVVDDFRDQVERCYAQSTGLAPKIYVCSASEGAEFLNTWD